MVSSNYSFLIIIIIAQNYVVSGTGASSPDAVSCYTMMFYMIHLVRVNKSDRTGGWFCCIVTTNHTYTYTCGNIVNTTMMNEHTSLEKYTSHFIRNGWKGL